MIQSTKTTFIKGQLNHVRLRTIYIFRNTNFNASQFHSQAANESESEIRQFSSNIKSGSNQKAHDIHCDLVRHRHVSECDRSPLLYEPHHYLLRSAHLTSNRLVVFHYTRVKLFCANINE